MPPEPNSLRNSVEGWDYFNQHVQSGLQEGRYLSGASTLVCAGPPALAAAAATGANPLSGATVARPIGLVQQLQLSQSAQVMAVMEIGSFRKYFLRGRVMGQLSLGRIVYHGPSLLRSLYAYLGSPTDSDVQFEALYQNDAAAHLNTSGSLYTKRNYEISPGSNNLWLNLESDIFEQPVGLLIIFRDSNKDAVGAFYIEQCNVVNHGISLDAGGLMLSEQTGIQYERIVPVEIDTVPLIRDSDDIARVIGSSVVGAAA